MTAVTSQFTWFCTSCSVHVPYGVAHTCDGKTYRTIPITLLPGDIEILPGDLESQVAIAISVLTAYSDGTLRTDQCDELDEALLTAYQTWEREHRDQEYDE